MKKIFLLLLLALPWPGFASGLPPWVKAEVAQKYAEAALIEWSAWSSHPLERSSLSIPPIVLARLGSDGTKVVQVVYKNSKGAYFVVLTADKDNMLHVFGRVATTESPETIANRFNDPTFDPASLLESEGD